MANYGFFIPAPDEVENERTRIDLTLGLDDVVNYYREMTVPGIGGLEFVREASWAVAGIALSKEIPGKNATEIANAIEAVGCRLYYNAEGKNYKYRGVRAFSRNNRESLLSFKDYDKKKRKKNYVWITYRQNIVSSLTLLGLCEKSTRFNQMVLSEKGRALKDAFLRQKKSEKLFVETALFKWVNGEKNFDDSWVKFLGPVKPSKEEREVMFCVLDSDCKEGYKYPFASSRRTRLNEIMEKLKKDSQKIDKEHIIRELKRSGKEKDKEFAHQIEASDRFDELRTVAASLLKCCVNVVISNNSQNLPLDKCLKVKAVREKLNELKKADEIYQKAISECRNENIPSNDLLEVIHNGNPKEIVSSIISKQRTILELQNEIISPGSLFEAFKQRVDSFGDFRSVRMEQWIKLWKDTKGYN